MMKKKQVVKKRGGGMAKKRGGGMMKKMKSGDLSTNTKEWQWEKRLTNNGYLWYNYF